MSKLELNINKESCGKWGRHNMINILKDYPQSNFTEWQLLNTFLPNNPPEVCVNMVCKVGILYLIRGAERCAIGQLEIISFQQSTETK